MKSLLRVSVIALAICAWPASAQAVSTWSLEQPAPPPGTPFQVPLGTPGDLQFQAPNRGLLTISGNGAVPKGIYYWNGAGWQQYATICGAAATGSDNNARIAWSGPDEFWTIADFSADQPVSAADERPASLCRFRAGAAISSHTTSVDSSDPYHAMNAAACTGTDTCWFAGARQEKADGSVPPGTFHLRWNGSQLETDYAAPEPGLPDLKVFDLESHQGELFESVRSNPASSEPRPIRRIDTLGVSDEDLFEPDLSRIGVELAALDSDGTQLWGVGDADAAGGRLPIAVRKQDDGDFEEVPLNLAPFAPEDRFVDVAAVPGTDTAWVVIRRSSETLAQDPARVAQIAADGTVMDYRVLPAAGPPRGPAAKIACPSATECWMATATGWLFRYWDGVFSAPDAGFFGATITTRPPDARTPQPQPDTNPVDDSLKNQQAPVVPDVQQPPAAAKQLKALLRRVRSKLKGSTLEVSFQLSRVARVGLIARRKGRVVARARPRKLKPGKHTLRLRLNRRKWPTSMRFRTQELDPAVREQQGSGGSDPDQVST